MSASTPKVQWQESLKMVVTRLFVSVVVLSMALTPAHSWSTSSHQQQTSRRDLFRSASAAVATSGLVMAGFATVTTPVQSAWAVDASIKEELTLSKSKLQEIPALLQQQEWEKVRTVLKTPPVNKLWNLGDSQNTVLKLAKETGDVELFELKDELAYNLQMCDQLTYDNVFVYFQPGSGKIKIKEPIETAEKAVKYLDQILASTE